MPLGPCNRITPTRTNHTASCFRDTPSPLSSKDKPTKLQKKPNHHVKNGRTGATVIFSDGKLDTCKGVRHQQQDAHSAQRSSARPTRKHRRNKSDCGEAYKTFSNNDSGPQTGYLSQWGRLVFVLFWASVIWLLRALAGFGSFEEDTHVCPSAHTRLNTPRTQRRPIFDKIAPQVMMVDWQGDYNMLPDRSPHSLTTTAYPEPEYHLPVPTPTATFAPEVAPFYDPRYDPFDIQQQLLDPEGYYQDGISYALKIHLKPTSVSTGDDRILVTNSRCRGARTRC